MPPPPTTTIITEEVRREPDLCLDRRAPGSVGNGGVFRSQGSGSLPEERLLRHVLLAELGPCPVPLDYSFQIGSPVRPLMMGGGLLGGAGLFLTSKVQVCLEDPLVARDGLQGEAVHALRVRQAPPLGAKVGVGQPQPRRAPGARAGHLARPPSSWQSAGAPKRRVETTTHRRLVHLGGLLELAELHFEGCVAEPEVDEGGLGGALRLSVEVLVVDLVRPLEDRSREDAARRREARPLVLRASKRRLRRRAESPRLREGSDCVLRTADCGLGCAGGQTGMLWRPALTSFSVAPCLVIPELVASAIALFPSVSANEVSSDSAQPRFLFFSRPFAMAEEKAGGDRGSVRGVGSASGRHRVGRGSRIFAGGAGTPVVLPREGPARRRDRR